MWQKKNENKHIEKMLQSVLETKNKCTVDVTPKIENLVNKIQFELKELSQNKQLLIKNEVSKIISTFKTLAQTVVKTIKNTDNRKKQTDEIRNKLENLLEITERIYDYSAMNENSRVNDNYNFYNLVKNEVIIYFVAKINAIIGAKIPTKQI